MVCRKTLLLFLVLAVLFSCQKPHLLPEYMTLELVDGKGQPIANAQVEAGQMIPSLFSPYAELNVLDTQITNDQGHAFFYKENGNLQIEIYKHGFCPLDEIRREELSIQEVSKRVEMQRITPITIELEP
ncbi:MAG: hypothetical protein HRT74_03885, partial [Flavobacteriales bacterium]|nr:hypothetical protein [Flavobacteriales bacterium]